MDQASTRYLFEPLSRFTTKKSVFLAGPRQVGKTTLAEAWHRREPSLFLNWDIPEDRERILKEVFTHRARDLPAGRLVLDEVHKYPRWKAALKGLFDRKLARLSILVTGSARLDIYQRGGDSLLGRYEYLRLHPLTLGELRRPATAPPPTNATAWLALGRDPWDGAAQTLARLEARSGFPEPFFSADPLEYGRWSVRRRALLLREDIRDLSQVKLLPLLEHVVLLLPGRVGSPLSVNALKEEVRVNHETVSTWLDLLERLYFVFRIPPYRQRVSRSLSKEKKLYLWDWAQIEDPGARFENLVASHLLKSVHLWTDLGYGEFSLSYLRDKEKHEIDFVVLRGRKPVVAIECKLADTNPAASWKAFSRSLDGVPRIQLVRSGGVDLLTADGIRIVSADRFLADLS